MKSKKDKLTILIGAVVAALMFFILYKMFKDSYKDIFDNLADTNMLIFAGMVLLGNAYYFIDAFVYYKIIAKDGYDVSYFKCVTIAYMSIFFNVTSFGAGIKPAQVLYLHKQGIDPGKGCGITMMPYIFHKTLIVVYAIVLLLINNMFVFDNFSDTFGYIYAGVGLSVLVIIFMILLCASTWFHKLVCKILDWTIGRTRFKDMNENIKIQIGVLRESTIKVIHKPKAWIVLTAINAVKMTCWYIIPAIAIYAAGGNLGGVTISEALTVTSLMQLLIGVVPTSGGVGSLEVVFSLLFAAVFGKITAGSSMILYRLSTYYVPFLFSVVMMIFVGRDLKKIKKREKENTPPPKELLDFDSIK